MSTNPRARAWLDLRADALLSNFARVRAAAGAGVRVIPMVKANAYGLGVEDAVRVLAAERPWGFGVATVDEGLEVRGLGWEGPIVVFAPAPPESLDDGVAAGLILSVGSLDAVWAVTQAAERADRIVEVHLEVDTGMGRSGVDWSRLEDWVPRFRGALGSRVRATGLFTHLHSAETDSESIALQADRFAPWERAFGSTTDGTICHMLNSAGVFRAPEHARDAVRPGIFLYGGSCGPKAPRPRPVAAVRARVVHVRDAVPGRTTGYGATHRAAQEERWATLAIGYGDGLPRALGNRGHALIKGQRVPIVGRVSMDVTVVNITGVDGVGVGDVATLIGRDGSGEITVDEVAEQVGTISYEVLTGFTSRLPRVWERAYGA